MVCRRAASRAGRTVVTMRVYAGSAAKAVGSIRRTSATWSNPRSGLMISVMPS